MKTLKKLMLVVAMVGGGAWLLAPASVALTACGPAAAGGGSGGGAGGGGGADCFAGTPSSNADFLNACVDQSVEKILKQTSWRAAGTVLPVLP